jgi:hypothetical protein
MSEKIQPSHIERDAYVYIRQSSMQRVLSAKPRSRRRAEINKALKGCPPAWRDNSRASRPQGCQPALRHAAVIQ